MATVIKEVSKQHRAVVRPGAVSVDARKVSELMSKRYPKVLERLAK